MSNEKSIRYALSCMEIKQFAIFSENVSGGHGKVKTAIQPGYDFTSRTVRLNLSVDYSEDDRPTLRAELRCDFVLHPDSALELTDDAGRVEIPRGLMIQFFSLAYGTMRGVILAKTAATPLATAILPPHNAAATFTAPVVFEPESH